MNNYPTFPDVLRFICISAAVLFLPEILMRILFAMGVPV